MVRNRSGKGMRERDKERERKDEREKKNRTMEKSAGVRRAI